MIARIKPGTARLMLPPSFCIECRWLRRRRGARRGWWCTLRRKGLDQEALWKPACRNFAPLRRRQRRVPQTAED